MQPKKIALCLQSVYNHKTSQLFGIVEIDRALVDGRSAA